MNTTRRSFFKLIAGAALAPIAAKAAAILPSVPMIWGDGIHDDLEGFQALFDGKVVEFANPEMAHGAGWFGNELRLPQGVFRVGGGLDIGSADAKSPVELIDGRGSRIILPHDAEYAIKVWTDGAGLVVDGPEFEFEPPPEHPRASTVPDVPNRASRRAAGSTKKHPRGKPKPTWA